MKKLTSKKFKDISIGKWFYLIPNLENITPILYMKCSYGAIEDFITDDMAESDVYVNCVTDDGFLDYIFADTNVWVEKE